MEENFAIKRTREYFDSFHVEERLIDAVVPDLCITLFGRRYATPIMTPAFSHLKTFMKEQENGMLLYSRAAKLVNTLNFIGMCENEEFAEIATTGADNVRIVKPYADRDKILCQLLFARDHGAVAVGMDIDHIFGGDGGTDVVMGERMACQTSADLEEYRKATELPFIVKGVLSVSDAIKCGEIGVAGIIVSHHHGRLPYAVPPLVVLPDIAKVAAQYGMTVIVDCGVDSGYDAFKAIALGADAVSAGRVLMPELAKNGLDGAVHCLNRMKDELAYMMAFCGCQNLEAIDATLLHRM